MDRCAVFIDAGYLYAAGGLLCHGTRARKDIDLDGVAFNNLVVSIAAQHCPAPVLRSYWYDGAKRGIATREQQTIAALPNVKLRLGRLNTNNQQKGVDALIYRDLMTLASERAIADAFLVSGDEDLREGVKAAQDRGVRVVLIGIKAVSGFNQSRELVEEVDDVVTLDKTDLSPIIVRRSSAALPTGVATPTPAAAAHQHATQWVANATQSDLQGLVATYPWIPKTLDMELIRATETALGRSLRADDAAHREMRASFWQVVRKAAQAVRA